MVIGLLNVQLIKTPLKLAITIESVTSFAIKTTSKFVSQPQRHGGNPTSKLIVTILKHTTWKITSYSTHSNEICQLLVSNQTIWKLNIYGSQSYIILTSFSHLIGHNNEL